MLINKIIERNRKVEEEAYNKIQGKNLTQSIDEEQINKSSSSHNLAHKEIKSTMYYKIILEIGSKNKILQTKSMTKSIYPPCSCHSITDFNLKGF